MKLASH